MKLKVTRRITLYLLCMFVPPATGLVLEFIHHTIRATAAMVFLLEVLAVAASGEALLAVLTSLSAALTFSYDFLPPIDSFEVSTPENLTALIAFLVTAVTGSQLSLRSQRRATEANRRREEMQKLQRFSSRLLLSDSVLTAAEAITREAALEFGFHCVELQLEGDAPNLQDRDFSYGTERAGEETVLNLDSEVIAKMRLFGHPLSEEFQSALRTIAGLILDRAKGAEDRVRLEAEQRSEELHTTVLNALAHNFRTPLTSIKIASSTLLSRAAGVNDARDCLSPTQERDFLMVIDEEADRLQALIRESLELARLESHRLHPKLELCSVSEIVGGVYRKVERYIPLDRIEVSVDKDLPLLRGDQILFEQMLFQVVDNAWKYSSPSARIWVSARVDWSYLILTVQNEGPPVPELEKERIFERFVRGSGSRTKIEGTGLGLTIARTIAQSYGGKLWLDPEPRGPAFRFAIPVYGARGNGPEGSGDRGKGID